MMEKKKEEKKEEEKKDEKEKDNNAAPSTPTKRTLSLMPSVP